MEDGLVPNKIKMKKYVVFGLNPCCDGRWSRTLIIYNYENYYYFVLILVVMEDGLVLLQKRQLRQSRMKS